MPSFLRGWRGADGVASEEFPTRLIRGEADPAHEACVVDVEFSGADIVVVLLLKRMPDRGFLSVNFKPGMR